MTGVIIPIVHALVFYFYLQFSGILLAFQNPKTEAFTMNNFKQVWLSITDPKGELFLAFGNTLKFYGLSLIMLFANFFVAYFFFKKISGYKAFRIIFYLPAIISGVAMTTVFMEVIKPMGPLGKLLEMLFGYKMPKEGLLSMDATALGATMAYSVWVGFTGNVVLFSGSLSRIPTEVLEAAKIDGCGFWREACKITIPLVWPMFSTMLVLSVAGFTSASGAILLLTNGAHKTTTLNFWMFNQVYGGGAVGGTGQYGIVSAASLLISCTLVIPLTLLTKKLTEKIEAVEY